MFASVALALALQEAATEPRLIVPGGFVAEIVAEAPEVRWPSAVHCLEDGSLLVAEDPMDMVGPAHEPIDRILRFALGKRRPDQRLTTVFAEGLYAVFGIESLGSQVFVVNTPHLTLLEDADRDGRAERRETLVEGLGPAPRAGSGFNDHVVSGVCLGLDGRLYLSVGDKGIPRARGRDGSEISLRGGGVVRLRPDGSRLEVLATGTRNHLDVVLDEQGEMFVLDNSDDGLGWWTRLAHVVEGGYYGYPFDYGGHPERMLPCIADFGGGAPAGGLFYGESAWPLAYRGSFFWCEWGKGSIERFELARDGATYRIAHQGEFARGEGGLEFRPLDLCLSPDGSYLYVADWGHPGWQSDEVTGRVWRIRRAGPEPASRGRLGPVPETFEGWIEALGDDSASARRRAQRALVEMGSNPIRERLIEVLAENPVERRRRHALWALFELGGARAREAIVAALEYPNDDVAIQALRALGQREGELPPAAFELLAAGPPHVRREAAICIGRLGGAAEAPDLIAALRHERDPWVRWSIGTALRRIGCFDERLMAWPVQSEETRDTLLEVVRGVYDTESLAGLAAFASGKGSGGLPDWPLRLAPARARALEVIAGLELEPAPWDGSWWSTQPARGPPPAKTLEWAGTALARATLREALADPAPVVRRAALEVLRASPEGALALVRAQFARETEPDLRRLALELFAERADADALELLAAVLRDPRADAGEQALAVLAASRIDTPAMQALLLEAVRADALDPEALAPAVAALAGVDGPEAGALLKERLGHPAEALRAAALRALAPRIGAEAPAAELQGLLARGLDDPSTRVQREAVGLAGELGARALVPRLLALAGDPLLRADAYRALASLPDAQSLDVWLAGLAALETREASRLGLRARREELLAELERRHLRGALREPLLGDLRRIYAEPLPLVDWRVAGPYRRDSTTPLFDGRDLARLWSDPDRLQPSLLDWEARSAEPLDGRVDLAELLGAPEDLEIWARSSFSLAQAGELELLLGSDGPLSVWIDGRRVHDGPHLRAWSPAQSRVELELEAGEHELLLRAQEGQVALGFSAALARRGGSALFEDAGLGTDEQRVASLGEYALRHRGDITRGYKLFNDTRRLGCVRCHALTTDKGRIGDSVGPDLDGIGARASRGQLISSILEPSRQIASGYAAERLWTTDGRQFTGKIVLERGGKLVLVEGSGERVVLPSESIAGRTALDASVMPDGYDALLTARELADIVTFLESLEAGEPPDGIAGPPEEAGRSGE
jgi:putative membrane-bound dehydrogenase-like protein